MQLYSLKQSFVTDEKFKPFYGKFAGHLFKNVSLHDDGHILLECVDCPALTVDRFIHVDYLDKVETVEAKVIGVPFYGP